MTKELPIQVEPTPPTNEEEPDYNNPSGENGDENGNGNGNDSGNGSESNGSDEDGDNGNDTE